MTAIHGNIEDINDVEDMLKMADNALYKAKAKGEIVLHFKPCSIKCNAELLIKLMKQCPLVCKKFYLKIQRVYGIYAYKKLLIQERKGEVL